MIKNSSFNFENAKNGFSDDKLEKLSRFSLLDRGLTPWANWESENSSFGKTFRIWARYPKFLPLCISSDHAVHWESRCWPNEINSRYKVFFTWNERKFKKLRNEHNKKAYHVPHPWVFYRKKYWAKLPLNRSGTLVYFAHSNNTSTPSYENLDEYMKSLAELPNKYKPICICLSFHDVEKGMHKKLRKYGYPIVTAGWTGAQDFIDRFYALLYQFRYATSPNIGSHTFYAIEAGVPFFLFGDKPKYYSKGSEAIPDGLINFSDYGDADDNRNLELLSSLLSERMDDVSQEQLSVVRKYLGMGSETKRLSAGLIIWLTLFSNTHNVIRLYIDYLIRIFNKLNRIKVWR